MNIVLLDCEDSYTYNIYDYLSQCGASVDLIHYEKISIDSLINYQAIILPPGPKAPHDIPILFEIIDKYKSSIPILGICLGHQAIGQYFGHTIEKSNFPIHGISVKINLENYSIFDDLEKEKFMVMRYNSLTVLENRSSDLEVICTDEFEDIMGFKHKEFTIYSFQFHPESIGTPQGLQLIKNWLKIILK